MQSIEPLLCSECCPTTPWVHIFGNSQPSWLSYVPDFVQTSIWFDGVPRSLKCSLSLQTLRRCYSRVKERGVGKRKSSYTFEQLERVFGQGGWDTQSCQPVLINSSGLYQEMESDGSTMEDYSQEDWGNHSQEIQGFPGEELGKMQVSIQISLECSVLLGFLHSPIVTGLTDVPLCTLCSMSNPHQNSVQSPKWLYGPKPWP